jgi:D-sedoheptulose 7-phosphate isomerase
VVLADLFGRHHARSLGQQGPIPDPEEGNDMSVHDYREHLLSLLTALDLVEIERAAEALRAARRGGANVFIAGNGGSAATASHMVTDLMFGRGLPEPGLRVIGLTDNQAVITATANDFTYAEVFARQIRRLGRPGDIVILVSASGDSENIITAATAARDAGMTVIGLTGFDGGRLRPLADICVHVPTPSDTYGPVEDIHLVVNHMLVAELAE